MRALDRVVAILEAVADSRNAVTPTVVASRVDLSLSTVSRLMRQMTDLGLLDRLANGGSYSLGVRLLHIAQAALEPNDLVQIALPEMQHLRDVTHETVSLFVRRNDVRICLAQVQSDQPIRRVVPVGFTTQLHLGATGTVLLAGMPAAERDRYLDELHMSASTLKALRARLADVSQRGYAMAVDEWVDGVSALAVGVFESDMVVASLSVAGPSYRFVPDVMSRFTDDLVSTAQRVSRRVTSIAHTA